MSAEHAGNRYSMRAAARFDMLGTPDVAAVLTAVSVNLFAHVRLMKPDVKGRCLDHISRHGVD